MEETCKDYLVAPVFKLKHLTVLYGKRLSYFPDMEMEAHKQGRDVVLIYNKDIGSGLVSMMLTMMPFILPRLQR